MSRHDQKRSADDALGEALSELGVETVFGASTCGSLAQCPVPEHWASLFADVWSRLAGGFGAAFVGDSILYVSSQLGGSAVPTVVHDPEDLLIALNSLVAEPAPVAVAFDIQFDRNAPLGREVDQDVVRHHTMMLSPEMQQLNITAVVGTLFQRPANSDQLDMLLNRGLGVATSSGALGVLQSRDPRHLGIVGLHERDIELAGLVSSDVVLWSGVDTSELDEGALRPALVQHIHPVQLGDSVARFEGSVVSSPSRLSATIDELVAHHRRQETCGLIDYAFHLGGARPYGTLIGVDRCDRGAALVRVMPIDEPGAVHIPPRPIEGFSLALAIVAQRSGRQAVAVTSSQPEVVAELRELAKSLDVELQVQRFVDGPGLTTEEHLSHTVGQFETARPSTVDIALRVDELDRLHECVGPALNATSGSNR